MFVAIKRGQSTGELQTRRAKEPPGRDAVITKPATTEWEEVEPMDKVVGAPAPAQPADALAAL
jgi:hypothetical protein